jgi:cellulose synthase/poly-beta-1,6-N-acetylglucosamine synthase-like glycosyltransferase
VITDVIYGINMFMLAYFGFINASYMCLLVFSYFTVRKYRRQTGQDRWRQVIQSPLTPGISVLAPAFNEEATVEQSVRSLLMLEYPKFEVVIINDGSKDATLEILKTAFVLHQVPMDMEARLPSETVLGSYRSLEHPNLVVIDKINGGKADALNAGINVSSYPLFCSTDADSLIEGEALLKVVRPFLEKPDSTVAVGGIVRVANGCEIASGQITKVELASRYLPLVQTVEYLRAFLFGRPGWSAMNSLLIISGAFGVFRKDVVIEIGGYRAGSVGEDVELVMRMHSRLLEAGRKYEMHFLPDPVCWTEVPESLAMLGRQRNRWQRGLMESLVLHKKMFFNRKYGPIGMIGVPYFFIFAMFAPLLELLGIVLIIVSFALGYVNLPFFGLFVAITVLFGSVLTTGSVVLEEMSFRRYLKTSELMKMIAAGFAENLGYRQLNLWWRATGCIDYLRGNTAWGSMERRGFGKR